MWISKEKGYYISILIVKVIQKNPKISFPGRKWVGLVIQITDVRERRSSRTKIERLWIGERGVRIFNFFGDVMNEWLLIWFLKLINHYQIILIWELIKLWIVRSRRKNLILFRMVGGEGGGEKRPPTSFSPVTSTNVGIRPQNVLTLSFKPFDRLV